MMSTGYFGVAIRYIVKTVLFREPQASLRQLKNGSWIRCTLGGKLDGRQVAAMIMSAQCGGSLCVGEKGRDRNASPLCSLR